MSIGKQTVVLRKQVGISQEELSQRSGISLRTIQRLEKDQVKPRGYTLNQLAQALGVSLKELQAVTHDSDENIGHQKLRTLNALGLLSVFLPIIHLAIQGYYWRSHLRLPFDRTIGSKIISFQIWWSVLMILTLVLFQVITFAISGQKTIGQFPWRLLIYVSFLVVNMLSIFKYSITLQKHGSALKIPFPALF